MKTFGNKLLVVFLKLLSRLPLSFLYLISTVLYLVLYKVLKYRLKVVRENLQKAFPEKQTKDLNQIEKDFYNYLCDLILESVKLFTANEKVLKNGMRYVNTELLDKLYEEKQSAVVVMSHSGNWEWVCKSSPLFMKNKVVVAYKPLSNPFFEKLMLESRTQFGVNMVPMAQIGRYLLQEKDPFLLILLSDQSPTDSKSSYWTTFLNRDTAVMKGAEKIVEKFKLPLLFNDVRMDKRGKYCGHVTLILDKKEKYQENEITELHTRILEKAIHAQPEIWLWSHKRWKLSRN